MKTLNRLCIAAVLTLTLAINALAGEIHTGYAPPPPPAEDEIGTGDPGEIQTPPGEIHTPGSKDEYTDPAAQAALSLLRAALSLF